jgi:hypothetical protein
MVKAATWVVAAMERIRNALKESMSVSHDRLVSQLTSTATELRKKALSVAFNKSWVRLAQTSEPLVWLS